MKKLYFTPGPSQLYPTVKKHILQALKEDIPSLSHRSDKFHGIVKDVYRDLRKLLNIPEDYAIFFTASATEAMERIIENCVESKSFHFVNGTFAKRFYDIALEKKKDAKALEVELGIGFDFEKIKIPANTELIAIAHNETSSGIAVPVSKIEKLADEYSDSLIAVDIVSSAPYVNLNFKKLDCVFFSVQKGFGLPAGLGILVVSPRAMQKAEKLTKKGLNVGSYHKFLTLYKHYLKDQTIETPNVLGIYLFSKVLEDMLHTGIKNIRKDTEEKAKLVYDFFEDHQDFKPFVKDKILRSKTVLVFGTPGGSKELLAKLKEHGFIVGAGYGEMKDKQIRIANFPAHTLSDIQKLLKNFN